MVNWSFRYIDKVGIIESVLTITDRKMSVVLDGIRFTGDDFDALKIDVDMDTDKLKRFTLSSNYICDCLIECDIPVLVCSGNACEVNHLTMKLTLGEEMSNGCLDRQDCILAVTIESKVYESSGQNGYFEGELNELFSKLPEGVYIRCCLSCQYSDYSPYGQGLFGTMMCFRNLKEEYMRVNSKETYWTIHDKYDRLVQETYLCSDYKIRKRNTGYRG